MEVVKNHILQIFIFNLVLNLIFLGLYILTRFLNIEYLLLIIYPIVLLITFFVDQSIIIDELGPISGVKLSLIFMKNHITKTFYILFIGFVVYFFISLISFYIPSGYIIGVVLTYIFLIPFLVILKTLIYLTKFKILDSYF
jgi:hypothetical protein